MMIGSNARLLHRHTLLQLSKPVEHNLDSLNGGCSGSCFSYDADEVFTVRCDVVRAGAWRTELDESRSNGYCVGKCEIRLCCYVHLQKLIRARDKEQLLPIR